ncbi:MAG: beta-propeller domain-containing protein, partial [Oscillospiraceae bacterium]|nr:beta-propeller domain-containing protein [Oscillospiraceae bacterium]
MRANEQIASLPTVDNFEHLLGLLETRVANNHDDEFMLRNVDSIDMAVSESAPTTSQTVRNETRTRTSGGRMDYSTTNIQVEGVDEADIVKTDGQYIYYVSRDGIVIVDARNPENLRIASDISYTRRRITPQEIYINGDKLIVIGTRRENNIIQPVLETPTPRRQETTRTQRRVDTTEPLSRRYYGEWDNPSITFTVARVYNIRNKRNVTLEREVEVQGEYLTSRMIGDNLHLIANQNIPTNRIRRHERVELNEEYFMPSFRDTAISDEFKLIDFSEIVYLPGEIASSYLNIASFNVSNNREANIESILGAGNNIYCSANNLYVTRTTFEGRNEWETHIYKFELRGARATYVASGSVPGRILNQFAKDEYDGYFRIATTSNDGRWQIDDMNNLYVLDDELNIVGRVEGIAPGESIYAMRFRGDRGYMVTFVEIDPLFVIDLSDPRNPTVLGELKIPGFSNYLHPFDENHLIGFGQEVELVNGM